MGNSSLIPFKFDNKAIRVCMDENGEPQFVAADVCAALELGNVSQALSRLDEDEKGISINDTLGGPQKMAIVNESGLYSLTFSSRKPEARGFRRWISHEVLPSLRKTGKYELAKPVSPPSSLDIAEHLVKAMREFETRLTRIEDTFNADQGEAQMMTVAAYVKWRNMRLSAPEIAAKGKAATRYSGMHGFPIQEISHRVWGKVNLYHIDVLREVFKQVSMFEGKVTNV